MKQEAARSIKSGQANMRIQSLSFARLPHQSALFLEYLRASSAVKKYYPNVPVFPSETGKFAGEVIAGYKTDRGQLCDALTAINQRIGAGTETLENIESLRSADTVAVVTGQQAGLFTGPLYTIYKALSAIKLADQLTESGCKAVPVFWIGSEDHDFDEVAQIYFSYGADGLRRLRYKPADIIEGVSVGRVRLDASMAGLIDGCISHLPTTESSAAVLQVLRTAYSAEDDFGSAFGKALAALFSNYGLVVIDPLDKKIKQLAAPIYKQVITRSDEIVAAIREQDRSLQADGFHSQVLVESDYFPLFWHDDEGRRSALRKVGDRLYRVKGGKRKFTSADLERIASEEPQRLSPGVMLRSVVQDHLLPSVCYIGGAAEIAYFAQNGAAYQVLDRPVTPIFHRQSFTIVESRQRRLLDKFGWGLTDLFIGKEKATLDAAEKILSPDLADLFADVDEKISRELQRLSEALSSSDPTLAANLATRRRKILYHIATLRKKALLSEARKDDMLRRQIDELFDSILPKGGLQERSLNVFDLINKHGFGFIDLLYDSIDLDDKAHRIIYL